MGSSGFDLSGSGVAGFCEHGIEASHSKKKKKKWEFIEWRALLHGVI
jgi:hypothetical protein